MYNIYYNVDIDRFVKCIDTEQYIFDEQYLNNIVSKYLFYLQCTLNYSWVDYPYSSMKSST